MRRVVAAAAVFYALVLAILAFIGALLMGYENPLAVAAVVYLLALTLELIRLQI